MVKDLGPNLGQLEHVIGIIFDTSLYLQHFSFYRMRNAYVVLEKFDLLHAYV